jgi:triosephosphate isomerase
MKKIPIIAGNWKMYKTIAEAKDFFSIFLPLIKESSAKILIAPPFTALFSCAEAVKGSPVLIGAQNISAYKEGAYTGEVSARMAKEAGAAFVLLGHSERRLHFHETGALLQKKLHEALAAGLIPILCVGETAEEREAGRSLEIVKKQLDEALSSEELKDLIIAYEPVWAIGTGKTATPQMAQEMHQNIRAHLREKMVKNCPILYGGSVKSDTLAALLKEDDIDGVLVGGASLDPKHFAAMALL